MALDTSLLNTQQYKIRIEGKVEQSRERSSALPYTSVQQLLKREPSSRPRLRTPTLLLHIYIYIYICIYIFVGLSSIFLSSSLRRVRSRLRLPKIGFKKFSFALKSCLMVVASNICRSLKFSFSPSVLKLSWLSTSIPFIVSGFFLSSL